MEEKYIKRLLGFLLLHLMIFVISFYFMYGVANSGLHHVLNGLAVVLFTGLFVQFIPTLCKESNRFNIGKYTEIISAFLSGGIILIVIFHISIGLNLDLY